VGFGHTPVGQREAALYRVELVSHAPIDPWGRRLHRVAAVIHAPVVNDGPDLHRVRSPRSPKGVGAERFVRSVAELLIVREVGGCGGCSCSEVGLVAA